ncbi:MAG: hypothetical protein LBF32_01010 [Streptococcaceae bacterium]|jgi:hypothetical protein|nr:hypothetical protein [Streptococcaceae bacterium]
MKKIKRKMLLVMMLFVCSIGFSNLVYGMEDDLKQSLFLPAEHWLCQRIANNVGDKFYLWGRAKADVAHIIVCKKWGSAAYTNNDNKVLIKVPLKPPAGDSYEDDFPNGQNGGYINFNATFNNLQTNDLNEAEIVIEANGEEQVYKIVEGGVAFGCYNQKTIDQKMDAALERLENADYRWINAGGAKRELVTLPCNGTSGYVITSRDGTKKIFLSLDYCVNLGISQYTFIPCEKVQERIDRWQRLQNISTRGGSGTFDLSKIKFGVKKS